FHFNHFKRDLDPNSAYLAAFAPSLAPNSSKRNPRQAVDPLFRFAGCPDKDEFLDGDDDGNLFANQNDAGAVCGGDVLYKVGWHRTSVLTDEDSSVFSGQS